MATITDTAKATFLRVKYQYDSLSQAIRLARECADIAEQDIQAMTAIKQELKKKWMTQVETFLKKMPLGSNVIELGEGWYGIRYLDDKLNKALKIEPIQEPNVFHVQRDGRNAAEFTRMQLDSILPAIIDERFLELYKHKLHNDAIDLVKQHCGYVIQREAPVQMVVEPVQPDNADPELIEGAEVRYFPTISHHAGVRWVQRKIGIINEIQATEYKRANLREVETAILNGFSAAEHVWTAEDGIEYYFDPENIMYVVGNNNIITLYESDFTFAKHINRSIVFEQLAVIDKAWRLLQDTEECHAELQVSVDNDLIDIQGRLASLKAEMELLQAKQDTKTAELAESSKVLSKAKVDYHGQCNKLFKKFDM